MIESLIVLFASVFVFGFIAMICTVAHGFYEKRIIFDLAHKNAIFVVLVFLFVIACIFIMTETVDHRSYDSYNIDYSNQ